MLNGLAYLFGYNSSFYSNKEINRINVGYFIHFNQNKAYPAFNRKAASAKSGCSAPWSYRNIMIICQLHYLAYLLCTLNFYYNIRQVFKPCGVITVS